MTSNGLVRTLLTLCALPWLGACGASAPVDAALYRDLPTLQREIARAEREGDLDSQHVRELAEAVVSREIASASGAYGAARVRSVRACASPVLPTLRKRSEKRDEVGAEAMLVRLTLNDVSPEQLVDRHHSDRVGAWRAVAARAALDPGDVLLRRRWFVDPDERVRRAAFEAALAAPDAGDVEALLESFRLDPDPLSRSLAARALGAIGGERAVQGLSDRFARVDEAERLAIIDALSMPKALASGGARELRIIAERKQGVVSVAAAGALLRTSTDDGALVGSLLTSIEHGAAQERGLAFSLVPLSDPRVLEVFQRASRNADSEVRVMALARLLHVPAERAEAEKRLRELASKDDAAAADARAALATISDRGVVPALVRDLEHGPAARRQRAALALFAMGEPGKAARALGDIDADVRLGVSCGVLARRTPERKLGRARKSALAKNAR